MLKEYRSRWGMYTTDVSIDKVRKHIVFTGLGDGGSYYVTTDENIADALEKKKSFGSDFYLHREQKEKEMKIVEGDQNPNPDTISKKSIDDVTNITQAREYLKKEGVDHRKLMTPAAIMKQAEEHGVEFPNLVV